MTLHYFLGAVVLSIAAGAVGAVLALGLAIIRNSNVRSKIVRFIRTFGFKESVRLGILGSNSVEVSSSNTFDSPAYPIFATSPTVNVAINWTMIRSTEPANPIKAVAFGENTRTTTGQFLAHG
jgi:hypothetical protein